MKIKLDVSERVTVGEIIKGFGFQRVVFQLADDFAKLISFTSDEFKSFEIQCDKYGTRFNPDKNKEVSFEIPEFIVDKIKEYFDALLDSSQGLSLRIKPLYDKFQATGKTK